jgi:DNA polymerase I-like protein with 3'-5' exonuclease and polymerase domains
MKLPVQNVPAVTEEGRRIRDAFIDKGHPLVKLDYSELEKRVLAWDVQ